MGFGKHFFDSGAFTLEKAARKWAAQTGNSKWEYFDQPEAFEFLQNYAEFVKQHSICFDYYANVDVIGNPELTHRNQVYLEKCGLNPIPVVHFGTDPKWLTRYMEEGHTYIALGGLVGKTGRKSSRKWLDQCFDLVCDKQGIPQVKLHGFGVTSFSLMLLYPWYSVDSTSWIRTSSYGSIYVPRSIKGGLDFASKPIVLTVSNRSKGNRIGDYHLSTATQAVKSLVSDWLHSVGTSIEEISRDEDGYQYRALANLRYFVLFTRNLPEWPWEWHPARRVHHASKFGV